MGGGLELRRVFLVLEEHINRSTTNKEGVFVWYRLVVVVVVVGVYQKHCTKSRWGG